jgi:hypothetical protein
MHPNQVVDAPRRNQQHGGVDALQINIHRAESEESASTASAAASSFNDFSTSTTVEVFFTVAIECEHERHDVPVSIGVVNEDTFAEFWAEIEERKESMGYGGRKATRSYILSGGTEPLVREQLYHTTALAQAKRLYLSANHATFEIRDEIRPGSQNLQRSAQQKLQQRLSLAKVNCKFNGYAWFIPVRKLKEILTESEVDSLFNEDPYVSKLRDRRKFTKFSCNKGLKLLATFILARINTVGETLCDFEGAGFTDAMMPLNPRCCPGFVDAADYDNICKNQWHTIPFDFRPYNKITKEPLNKSTVIPFLKMEQLGGGGFGDVFKVSIYPEQQHLIATSEVSLTPILKRYAITDHSGQEQFLCREEIEKRCE